MALKKSPAAKAHAQCQADKEVKEAALKSLLEQAQEGVTAIENSGQWAAFLTFAASFYQYSPYNWGMIFRQRPDATHVAGFNTWKNKYNRFVKKGEKGIVILRPITRKCEDKQTGERAYFLAGFASTYVFDVSQTEGEPVPKPTLPEDVSDDCPLWGAYANMLAQKASTHGMKVVLNASDVGHPDAKGSVVVDKGAGVLVRVKGGMSHGQTLKTLVHELAHVCLHVNGGFPDLASKKDAPGVVLTKASVEVEAESVAYVVCKHLGLDTSGYSFPYLAQWRAQGGEAVKAQTFHLLGRVQKAAKRILEWHFGEAAESEA